MELLIAAVGVFGTLAAAVVTQFLSSRAERARREDEDRSRWLTDRLRINARFLAECLSLERELWSTAAQLDDVDRPERMPGYTTILLTPEEGLPGLFDENTRAIIVESIEDAFKRLDKLEEAAAEIALVGTPDEVRTAAELHEALWSVVGLLEVFAPFDEAADAVQLCRSARDRFTAAARSGVRTDGQVVSIDRRPRATEQPGAAGAVR